LALRYLVAAQVKPAAGAGIYLRKDYLGYAAIASA